jgi:hypothetical protein
MKTMKPICLSLLVLTGTLLGARGEPLRTDINPALLYYRSFLLAPDPVSAADWDYLASKTGKEQKLPERFGKIVAGYDNQFLLVRQAAHVTVPCDWGIDLTVGPNAMLPHLARAKAVAQAAQLRAAWALQQGRQDDAREDLLAAFVLGRNASRDGTLIGVLVQHAIEALDYGTLASHFGEFSPETLKQLVEGFDAAPARQTMSACMPGEKHNIYDWAVNKLLELQKAHPGDDARVMAGFRETGYAAVVDFVEDTNFWPRLVVASGGTSDGVLRLLRETEPLYSRVVELMALPQPEYEIRAQQFSADIQNSSNPFFRGHALFWEKYQRRAREFKIQAQQALVRAAVEYKLHGEAGLKNVMDPFGKRPFGFRRFVFKGVDRGFELRSAYDGAEAPFVMIFVENPGAAFQITGPDAGKAIDK